MMGLLDELDRRFPGKTLAIRRRIKSDPVFEELCLDLDTAVKARDYWQTPPQQSEERANDYCALVAELEKEIETALES